MAVATTCLSLLSRLRYDSIRICFARSPPICARLFAAICRVRGSFPANAADKGARAPSPPTSPSHAAANTRNCWSSACNQSAKTPTAVSGASCFSVAMVSARAGISLSRKVSSEAWTACSLSGAVAGSVEASIGVVAFLDKSMTLISGSVAEE